MRSDPWRTSAVVFAVAGRWAWIGLATVIAAPLVLRMGERWGWVGLLAAAAIAVVLGIIETTRVTGAARLLGRGGGALLLRIAPIAAIGMSAGILARSAGMSEATGVTALAIGTVVSNLAPGFARWTDRVAVLMERMRQAAEHGLGPEVVGDVRVGRLERRLGWAARCCGRLLYNALAYPAMWWARWRRAGLEPDGFRCAVRECALLDDDPQLRCPECEHAGQPPMGTWPTPEAPLVVRCRRTECSRFAPTWRALDEMETRNWQRAYPLCLGRCARQDHRARSILILGDAGQGVDVALTGIGAWALDTLDLDGRSRALANRWRNAGRNGAPILLPPRRGRATERIEGPLRAGNVTATIVVDIERCTDGPIWAGSHNLILAAPTMVHDEDRALVEVAGRLALATAIQEAPDRPTRPPATRWQRVFGLPRPQWSGRPSTTPPAAAIGPRSINLTWGGAPVLVVEDAADMSTLLNSTLLNKVIS